MTFDGLRREFTNPGNEFRFAPFWFINHELTEEETRWQVRRAWEALRINGKGDSIACARGFARR